VYHVKNAVQRVRKYCRAKKVALMAWKYCQVKSVVLEVGKYCQVKRTAVVA